MFQPTEPLARTLHFLMSPFRAVIWAVSVLGGVCFRSSLSLTLTLFGVKKDCHPAAFVWLWSMRGSDSNVQRMWKEWRANYVLGSLSGCGFSILLPKVIAPAGCPGPIAMTLTRLEGLFRLGSESKWLLLLSVLGSSTSPVIFLNPIHSSVNSSFIKISSVTLFDCIFGFLPGLWPRHAPNYYMYCNQFSLNRVKASGASYAVAFHQTLTDSITYMTTLPYPGGSFLIPVLLYICSCQSSSNTSYLIPWVSFPLSW